MTLTVNGPEFSNGELGSEGSCSSKIAKKSSKGLHIPLTSDQRPLNRVTKHGHNASSGHWFSLMQV